MSQVTGIDTNQINFEQYRKNYNQLSLENNKYKWVKPLMYTIGFLLAGCLANKLINKLTPKKVLALCPTKVIRDANFRSPLTDLLNIGGILAGFGALGSYAIFGEKILYDSPELNQAIALKHGNKAPSVFDDNEFSEQHMIAKKETEPEKDEEELTEKQKRNVILLSSNTSQIPYKDLGITLSQYNR